MTELDLREIIREELLKEKFYNKSIDAVQQHLDRSILLLVTMHSGYKKDRAASQEIKK